MNRIGRDLVILAALGMLLSTDPAAQSDKPSPPEPPTLDKLDRVQDLEAAHSDLEKAVTLVNQIAREKRTHCVRAFGDSEFCDCLKDNLPVKVSFLSYIQMVTSTKEGLGHAKLSVEQKSLVDNTLAAREFCVSKRFGAENR